MNERLCYSITVVQILRHVKVGSKWLRFCTFSDMSEAFSIRTCRRWGHLRLKYFQYEGRFPSQKGDVLPIVIVHLAQPLGVVPEKIIPYDWEGRTIKSHRAAIRTFLDVHEATLADQEGLNVVENWNSATNFIHFGRHGEFSTNNVEDQELAMLALHLLQIALTFIQTLMIQEVLSEPAWMNQMTKEDLRGLTPLIYSNVNPYGLLRLNMTERLTIERAEAV